MECEECGEDWMGEEQKRWSCTKPEVSTMECCHVFYCALCLMWWQYSGCMCACAERGIVGEIWFFVYEARVKKRIIIPER